MAFRKINDGVPVPSGITGSASSIITDTMSPNRAAFFDASGRIAAASTTVAQLDFLETVTSNVQTQLNGKAATAHTHVVGDVSGLQTSLDSKASTGKAIAMSIVFGG